MLSSRIPQAVSIAVAAAAAIVVVVGVDLHAQIPTNGVIYGCVRLDRDKDEGKLLRLVAADEACKKNETRIHWNVAGPQGSGNTGPAGPP